MPQATSIVVNDRESTPVAHTFVPQGIQGQVAQFAEAASVPIGQSRLTVSWRKAANRFKVRLLFVVPVVVTETINSVDRPSVARTSFAEVNLTFDETSTLQERKNTVGMLANVLAASQTEVNAVVTQLEGLY